jgi:hypothetical protein
MNKRQKKKAKWKRLIKANEKYKTRANKDHPVIIGMLVNMKECCLNCAYHLNGCFNTVDVENVRCKLWKPDNTVNVSK